MTQDELRAEHDRLYRQASAAIMPLIELHGNPTSKLSATQDHELRSALELLDRVLQMNSGNWAAMWLVGKGRQRLRDFDGALKWFLRADQVNPGHPDVLREAAITALELGRASDAIPFCERAIEAKPTDPGLQANLALAMLFSGNAQRAHPTAKNALQRDPSDAITRRIVQVCEEVLAGKIACPRHTRDII